MQWNCWWFCFIKDKWKQIQFRAKIKPWSHTEKEQARVLCTVPVLVPGLTATLSFTALFFSASFELILFSHPAQTQNC